MEIKNGWLTKARSCPSPNYNERPNQDEPSLLVIHNISLPPGQFGGPEIEQFFQNQLDWHADPFFKDIEGMTVSAHFLVRRCGEIVQFVSTDKRAWHAGVSEFEGRSNCNDFSIGIELEGTDQLAYEAAQYRSLTELTLAIMAAYPEIALDRITGHANIAPDRKTDPGESFDWPLYRSSL